MDVPIFGLDGAARQHLRGRGILFWGFVNGERDYIVGPLTLDTDLRLDHDTTQGVLGDTDNFYFNRHADVTSAISSHFGVDIGVPGRCNIPERADLNAVKDFFTGLEYR